MNERATFVVAVIALYGGATAVAIAGFAYGYPYLGAMGWLVAGLTSIKTPGDA